MSIELHFIDWRNVLYFFSFSFSFRDLYTLVWIRDTSAPESNKAWNFCLLIFIIHELGLPASSILNVGISLSNLLSQLASSWFDCTSFHGSCFADLGSQSCLKCVADTGIYCSPDSFFLSTQLLHISKSEPHLSLVPLPVLLHSLI